MLVPVAPFYHILYTTIVDLLCIILRCNKRYIANCIFCLFEANAPLRQRCKRRWLRSKVYYYYLLEVRRKRKIVNCLISTNFFAQTHKRALSKRCRLLCVSRAFLYIVCINRLLQINGWWIYSIYQSGMKVRKNK